MENIILTAFIILWSSAILYGVVMIVKDNFKKK